MMADVSSLFSSVQDILEHIKDVNQSVIETSDSAFSELNRYLSEAELDLPDSVIRALQMQDILRQQLSGSTDAINLITKSISQYRSSITEDAGLLEQSLGALDDKLKTTLEEAKVKKAAFSGDTENEDGNDVEFFSKNIYKGKIDGECTTY
jgi:histone H3/H4